MTLRRLLANIAVGIVLAVVLIGLTFIIIDERASRNEDRARQNHYVQEIPFK